MTETAPLGSMTTNIRTPWCKEAVSEDERVARSHHCQLEIMFPQGSLCAETPCQHLPDCLRPRVSRSATAIISSSRIPSCRRNHDAAQHPGRRYLVDTRAPVSSILGRQPFETPGAISVDRPSLPPTVPLDICLSQVRLPECCTFSHPIFATTVNLLNSVLRVVDFLVAHIQSLEDIDDFLVALPARAPQKPQHVVRPSLGHKGNANWRIVI